MKRGYLACEFFPNADRRQVQRRLQPVWTVHYQECMDQLYGMSRKQARPPTLSAFPEPLPSYVNSDLTASTLAVSYRYWLNHYTDGRPEGALYIVVNWLHEVFETVVTRKVKRHWELMDLRDEWIRTKKLAFSPSTHGLTESHNQYLYDSHLLGLGKEVSTKDVYVHKSAKQHKQDAFDKSKKGRKAAAAAKKAGKAKKKTREPDVVMFNREAFVAEDRQGNQYKHSDECFESLRDD